MSLTRFERLLKTSIGLDTATIGRSTLERAVRERERACGLDERDAYWTRVHSSESELQSLIEAVVVPETWFFRDRETFAALGSLARQHVVQHPERPLRVLSLPCSTGEEPYSIVMAALDAGLTPEQIQVDAIDVSHRALSHGRRGVYGRRSFRGTESNFRSRYFEQTADGSRIREELRHRVTFRQGNLLEPASLPGAGIYDLIFCRNVLIYFDRAAQVLAAGVLARLLAARGVLFVGAAESHVLTSCGFGSAHLARVTALVRRDGPVATSAPGRTPAPSTSVPRSRIAADRSARAVLALAACDRTGDATHDAKRGDARAADSFDAANQLANEGRFAEAAALCERFLRNHAPSADVFHLLGLVRDAAGDRSEAAACYRKALYLDPRHHDTLVHLALLMEAQDNRVEADLLRTRARRASQEGVEGR
jgi:chemotaxis protein methyltransferase WspC